jgi:hypothetical protein
MEFSHAPFVVFDLASPEGGTLDGVLGMNFFWNRNVIFEPSLVLSSFFHVSDPVPFAAGDFNLDLYVDDVDLADLVACQTGPALGLVGPDCDHVDIDGNGAIDLADVASIQRCFSGQASQADSLCGS